MYLTKCRNNKKRELQPKAPSFHLPFPHFPPFPPPPCCLPWPLSQKGAQQKCLIYQMSTPKRRQHLSSSMTMLMTTATPAAMATAAATPAATASSAAWAKRRAAAIVNTLPTRRDSPYPPLSIILCLSLSVRLSLSSPTSARGNVLKNECRFPHTVLFIVAISSRRLKVPFRLPFPLPLLRSFLSSRPAPADSHLLNEFDGRQALKESEQERGESERDRQLFTLLPWIREL